MKKANQVEPSVLMASDKTPITYFKIAEAASEKALLFLHCGGGHINEAYLRMATGLNQLGISCYLMDLRGHGLSGGKRGDTPDKEQLFLDMDMMLQLIQRENPGAKILIGGHSISAGLILNFINRKEQRAAISELYFIAPNFGRYSNTYRIYRKDLFVKSINWFKLFAYRWSKHNYYKNDYVVTLRVDKQMLKKDPLLIAQYTNEMADALTPQAPIESISNLKIPFNVIVGGKDILFNAKSLQRFCNKSSQLKQFIVIPELNHFSIIKEVPQLFKNSLAA
ncbi:alpha/beta fold hydrolase [Legionella saoudiensis]|uniref:alpha/beta fold hydrolase n=1 Tax=Legionella saoudiensis TaxID=1750561 RepID=UPI000730DE68|nr:alpha/beta fold hydrolase [Legionella saoudiensis]